MTALPHPRRRVGLATAAVALLVVAIYVVMVLRFGSGLREEIHEKMIERSAALLHPMALQLISDSEAALPAASEAHPHLVSVLKSARQEGILAMAIFDSDGATLERVPSTQLFVELPFDDYVRLSGGGAISRYHPAFPLHQHFAGIGGAEKIAPVLEVLLPMESSQAQRLLGFARYYIDARSLSGELSQIDARIDRQILANLAIGSILILLIMAAAYLGLTRAQRLIEERNDRLARANFELTLAAKASALGQITSHLIHGLQGPVAGLQAVVRRGEASADWESAAQYTERLQAMISETVGMLSDVHTETRFELTMEEIAEIVRERNARAAGEKEIDLSVETRGEAALDNHRGSLLCLIATNLVQNAIQALPRGGRVNVAVACNSSAMTLVVSDNGPGICPTVRDRLFQPGRSGRPGGTGLGLAISHLLARQIGAELDLAATGPTGTTFRLHGPLTLPA